MGGVAVPDLASLSARDKSGIASSSRLHLDLNGYGESRYLHLLNLELWLSTESFSFAYCAKSFAHMVPLRRRRYITRRHPRQEDILIHPLPRWPTAQISLPAFHLHKPMLQIQTISLMRCYYETWHIHFLEFVCSPLHEHGSNAFALISWQRIESHQFYRIERYPGSAIKRRKVAH